MAIIPTPISGPLDQSNIVLTSVVISAFVSALISGFFLLVNEWRRRVSEEKRFRLELALKFAELRDKQFTEWTKYQKQETILPSIVDLFRVHLEEIEKLWRE